MGHLSEPGPKAEAELLHLVVILFQDREGQVDTDRTEWRAPGNADASRQTDRIVIDKALAGLRDRIHFAQRTDVAEGMTSNAELIRETNREGKFDTAAGKAVAAQGVVAVQFTRTDTGRGETAQAVATNEEAVGNRDILTQADDIADLAEEAQHRVFGYRKIDAGTKAVARKLRIATKAGDLVVEADEIAFRRVDTAVAMVVHQLLANQRHDTRALLLTDEARGVGSDVLDRGLLKRIVEALS